MSALAKLGKGGVPPAPGRGGGKAVKVRSPVDFFVRARELYEPLLAEQLDGARPPFMWHVLYAIGTALKKATLARTNLFLDPGLWEMDDDLVDLSSRYSSVYKPLMERLIQLDPEEWTDQDWDDFENMIEGPVLVWPDLQTCAEQWPVEGVPPCEGPDLLTAMRLLNQLDVVRVHKIQETMFAAIADTLSDYAEGAATAVKEIVLAVADGATEAAKWAAGVVGDVVKKTWWWAVPIVALFAFMRRK